MERRDFLKSAVGVGIVSLLPGCSNDRKPNIILIMADDLGYGDLGCYGNDWIETPNIDALAGDGMKFTDYHSNCPVCSPTRAALLTGRYQQRAGIDAVVTAAHHRHTGLDTKELTFAEVLKTAGYRTAIFGKWHVGYRPEFNPVRQGFDEFIGYVSGNVDYQSHIDQAGYEDWWKQDQLEPENGYTTDLVSEHGVEFIKRHKEGPFCLYLAHECPHYPYQGPDDPPDRSPGQPQPTHGSRPDKKAAYKEMIESMDAGVGRVVKTVKELGLAENTLIFFCSDNGATGPGSTGGLRGKKGTLWEGGTRVPAIAWWPGKIAPGAQTDQRVLSMDLFPTLTAIAAAKVPREHKLDGVDISPVLFDNKPLHPRKLFFHYRNKKAAYDGPWKYHFDGQRDYLFNLEEDLAEQHDLSETHPEIRTQLEADYERWWQEVSQGVEFRT